VKYLLTSNNYLQKCSIFVGKLVHRPQTTVHGNKIKIRYKNKGIMAKIEVESLLGDIQGQIGGLIITKKKKTKYVREKRKKKNNHTKPKQKTESRFGDVSKIWTTLTVKERRTWLVLFKTDHKFKNKKHEKISDPRYLFIGLNRTMQEIGEPINRLAPAYKEPQLMFSAKAEIILKGKDLSMNLYFSNEIEEDTKVIVMATASLRNPSDLINEREYRIITVLDSKFVSGSSIKKPYLKVFGKIGGVGEEFGFKFKPVHKLSGIKGYEIYNRAEVIESKNQ